jgi:hypothetical protein
LRGDAQQCVTRVFGTPADDSRPRRRSASFSRACGARRAALRCVTAKASPQTSIALEQGVSGGGKKRLLGDTQRKASLSEISEIRKENARLEE